MRAAIVVAGAVEDVAATVMAMLSVIALPPVLRTGLPDTAALSFARGPPTAAARTAATSVVAPRSEDARPDEGSMAIQDNTTSRARPVTLWGSLESGLRLSYLPAGSLLAASP